MATTFHLFPHLPWEIRSRIWELTVEPREVEVRSKSQDTILSDELAAKYNIREHTNSFRIKVSNFYSSTPVPAPLLACREARSHLAGHGRQNSTHYTYRQVFRQTQPRTIVNHDYDDEWKVKVELPSELWLEPEIRLKLGLDMQPRYIWVNFDVDMISVGENYFFDFEDYYLTIKRFKFSRFHHDPELFDGLHSRGEISRFANAEEIHVVCPETSLGARYWENAHEERYFPCGIDKLFFIDLTRGGRMVTASENDAECRAERWAGYRVQGLFINPDTRGPLVPWLPEGWFEGQEDWDVWDWGEYYGNWEMGYRANGAFIYPGTKVPFVPYLPEGWFEGQEDQDARYWGGYYDLRES